MTRILAIDPGTHESGHCLYDGKVITSGVMDMSGERIGGGQYDIEVTRGVTFRVYSLPISLGRKYEVHVEDGVISVDPGIAEPEMTEPDQARAWAALLLAAADELEGSK